MGTNNKKDMFTKKKAPPDFSTFRGIAEVYYDYGLLTPTVVNAIRNVKKKYNNLKKKKIK